MSELTILWKPEARTGNMLIILTVINLNFIKTGKKISLEAYSFFIL